MVDTEGTFPYATSGVFLFEKCMRRFVRHTDESTQTGIYSRFSKWFRRLADTDFEFQDQLLLVSQKGTQLAFPRPLPTVNFQHICFGYEDWLRRKYSMPGFVEVLDGDVVIDCGGYVGGFALSASRLASKVYVFEPAPLNAVCARRNLAVYDNTTIVEAGLYRESGDMTLNLSSSGVEHSLLSPDKGKTGLTQSIPVWSLKDFCKLNEAPAPDFVKIEAEGVELEVWEGLADLRPSRIAIDVSPERDGKSPAEEFKRHLTEAGYEHRQRKGMLFAKRIE